MNQPIRIQRKRTKGYKMPPNTVSVTRPGKWGNPFTIGKGIEVEFVLERYRIWLKARLQVNPNYLDPLRGKNLACFCPLDKPCHADILLKLAN